MSTKLIIFEICNFLQANIYSTEDKQSCFFSNEDSSSEHIINYQGVNYTIPAWSVSILPDCKNEVYNTAKVKKK